ncbi:MAG: carbamoyltransferase, partial [Nitrospirota bacterium]|nr:carbamoyltransferase [Nitrospirota bacterium]
MRDASAALVEDGRVIAAAEEERFVRVKHVTALPLHAIRYCLKEAGIEAGDLDAIAVPWKYWVLGRRSLLALGSMLRSPQLLRVKGKRSLERMTQEWTELACLSSKLTQALCPLRVKPTYLDHHLCHAASTFLVSPFERAAILIVDGASESHTALLAVGEGTQIRVLKRIPLPHSLGQFYAAMTAFLGFRPDYDEYIVMGLAAYGKPIYAEQIRTHILRLLPDGAFQLNTRVLDFHLARVGIFPLILQELLGSNRRRDEEITQRHRDLAASA